MKTIILIVTAFVALLNNNLTAQTTKLEWAKQIGSPAHETMATIAVDNSGNVYTSGFFKGEMDFDPGIANFTLSSDNGQFFLSKLDLAGNFVWARQFHFVNLLNISTFHIQPDSLGNIYIVGTFQGSVDFDPGPDTTILENKSFPALFILKIYPTGNFAWVKQVTTGNGYIFVNSIVISAKNILAAGNFSGTFDFDPGSNEYILKSYKDEVNNYNDGYILKLDTTGNFVWAKQISGSRENTISSIAMSATGDIYSIGQFWEKADFDPSIDTFNIVASGTNSFVSKLDTTGNFVWAKLIPSKQIKGINIDLSGNVVLVGEYLQPFDGIDDSELLTGSIFILKLSEQGEAVWVKTIGGDGENIANSMTLDSFGNIYITGMFSAIADFDPAVGKFELTAASYDIFISKLNSLGSFIWAKQLSCGTDLFGINSTIIDKLNTIVVDKFGNVYTEGVFAGTADFDPESGFLNLTSFGQGDIFIQKLSQTTTGITEYSLKELISAPFPNPSSGKISIENPFKNNEHVVSIAVYTIEGELLKEYTSVSDDKLQIDLSKEKSGVYAIKLASGIEVYVAKVTIIQ